MARRPRLDIAGYHHVLNRGVERRAVFLDEDDYEMFLALLCEACTLFNIKVHSYCLMSNHYHLLLELQNDNLSKLMRFINSRYAIYFNKKLKRVGHLWQGRFKSWYITDEAYLYTLIKYIEFNPLKANMIENLVDYKYSAYRSFVGLDTPLTCLVDSVLFKHYLRTEERVEFFTYSYDENELALIAKSSSLVSFPVKKKDLSLDELEQMFKGCSNLKERNIEIIKAIDKGFSQHKIAKVLSLSQAAISLVVKGMK